MPVTVFINAGASVEKLGEAAACAVKRINLDMRMAYTARKAGAELREGFEVVAADFDKQQGLWTVSSSEVSTFWQKLTRLSDCEAYIAQTKRFVSVFRGIMKS